MTIRVIILLLLSLDFLCGTPEIQARTAAASASLAELLSCSGLPCVDLKLPNGQVLRLAIDTGNPRSILDTASAERIGLILEPVHAPDGHVMTGFSTGVLPDLTLGSSKLPNVRVVVTSLTSAIDGGQAPKVDGTLGWGAFRGRVLELNFTQHRIEVGNSGSDQSACAGGKISFVTFGNNGPPIVATTGFRVNDKPVLVQVDTMFSGTLLVFPEASQRLAFTREASSSQKEHFPFTDSGVDMIRSEASDESFGSVKLGTELPLYFPTPGVHLPDGLLDGTVGIGLLKLGTASFDFKKMCFELTVARQTTK